MIGITSSRYRAVRAGAPLPLQHGVPKPLRESCSAPAGLVVPDPEPRGIGTALAVEEEDAVVDVSYPQRQEGARGQEAMAGPEVDALGEKSRDPFFTPTRVSWT